MKPEEDLDNTYVWMTFRDNGLSSTYEHFIQTICPPSRDGVVLVGKLCMLF